MGIAAIVKIVAIVAGLLIGVALTYGVLRLVAEQHKQNCIEEAQARFPVSPSGKLVGPAAANASHLERALGRCEATVF